MKYLDPIFLFSSSIILLLFSEKFGNQNSGQSNLYLLAGIVMYVFGIFELIKKYLKK